MPKPTIEIGVISESEKSRFWSKVSVRSGDECWPWMAGLKSGGYGNFFIAGRLRATHRVAFTIAKGSIPHGLSILHSCDNPRCCNPQHLRAGTAQDNANDKIARGRQAKGDRTGARLHPETVRRGEAHHWARLTEPMVRQIRHARDVLGLKYHAIAARFGISVPNAYVVATRRGWAHVT